MALVPSLYFTGLLAVPQTRHTCPVSRHLPWLLSAQVDSSSHTCKHIQGVPFTWPNSSLPYEQCPWSQAARLPCARIQVSSHPSKKTPCSPLAKENFCDSAHPTPLHSPHHCLTSHLTSISLCSLLPIFLWWDSFSVKSGTLYLPPHTCTRAHTLNFQHLEQSLLITGTPSVCAHVKMDVYTCICMVHSNLGLMDTVNFCVK